MDEKILAYRSELQKRSENTQFWTKTILTVEEAAAYTGIGRAKIRQIISQGNCPFTVNNGTQICVIREAFIDYLESSFAYRRRENYAENKKKRQVESRASDRRIAKG